MLVILGDYNSMEAFWRFVEQIIIELALEIVFISLTRVVVQRKYSVFQPLKARN